LHSKVAQPPVAPHLALTKRALPAFKHAIWVAANCGSRILALHSIHEGDRNLYKCGGLLPQPPLLMLLPPAPAPRRTCPLGRRHGRRHALQ